jgi:hypothetical protein
MSELEDAYAKLVEARKRADDWTLVRDNAQESLQIAWKEFDAAYWTWYHLKRREKEMKR